MAMILRGSAAKMQLSSGQAGKKQEHTNAYKEKLKLFVKIGGGGTYLMPGKSVRAGL
jgi:hypothetical protein